MIAEPTVGSGRGHPCRWRRQRSI